LKELWEDLFSFNLKLLDTLDFVKKESINTKKKLERKMNQQHSIDNMMANNNEINPKVDLCSMYNIIINRM